MKNFQDPLRPCLKSASRSTRPCLIFFEQTLIKNFSADLAVKKFSRSVWRKNNFFYFRREKNRKIRLTLFEKILPDPDKNILSRLCVKFFHRTLPKKFLAPYQTLLKMVQLSDRTLLKIF